jgi:cell cycle related kinase
VQKKYPLKIPVAMTTEQQNNKNQKSTNMDDYLPNRYKLLKKVGEGVHGVVIKAIDTTNDMEVAIKKIPLKTKHGGISPNALREIKVLQHCDCENIITLLDMYPDLAGLSLVFDYMPLTLYAKLKDDTNPLSRPEIKKFMQMLLKGLKYLHDFNIMHRDIKPANLLISGEGVLKIADFGLARLFNASDKEKCYSPQVTTRWYRAPEILWGTQLYGSPIDLWAAGCVFSEMLRGIPLFAGNTDIEQLALVVRTLGSPSSNDWPALNSLPDYSKIHFPNSKGEQWVKIFPTNTTSEEFCLVDGLIRYNPDNRLTALQALQHDYFI